ncbi:MAG: hypothetical protein HKN49_10265 [Gammaproteobacteria bacterium]|nr:hypothetical protein [Gammaproteobacteria bacterium]
MFKFPGGLAATVPEGCGWRELSSVPYVDRLVMSRKSSVRLAGYLLLLSLLNTASASLQFHFDDQFDAEQRDQLKGWVSEVASGVEALVGEFGFDVHIHFRRARSREPVPWANTLRGRRQGIRFHVDPRHSESRFRDDWTASHELSHLVLPYVGRRDSWFAEGFASYMQYQVMHANGVLSADAAARRYNERLDNARRNYRYPRQPFLAVTGQLRRDRAYRTLYWGGAAYFIDVDRVLRAQGSSLVTVLGAYLDCCRRNTAELDSLVADLDRLSGSSVFSDTLHRYRRTPGFPPTEPVNASIVAQQDATSAHRIRIE